VSELELLALDLEVCRKVFGKEPLADEHMHRGWMVSDSQGMVNWEEQYELPPYSTDIAAAWAVVEKMEADGWGHDHLRHSAAAEQPEYRFGFMQSGKGIRSRVADEAETMPLAICRAALKAVAA